MWDKKIDKEKINIDDLNFLNFELKIKDYFT